MAANYDIRQQPDGRFEIVDLTTGATMSMNIPDMESARWELEQLQENE